MYTRILIRLAMLLIKCWLHDYPITIRLSGSIVTTELAAPSTSLETHRGSRGRMDLSCKSRTAKVRDVWQCEYLQEQNGLKHGNRKSPAMQALKDYINPLYLSL